MRRIVGAFSFVLLLSALAAPATTAADAPPFSIAPRTVMPYGVSYVNWTERALEWIFGSSESRSPLAHPERCANNQHGRIWLLANVGFGEAPKVHCTISQGTPVLITPGGGGCDSSLGGPTTAAGLQQCTREGIAGLTNFRVIIDGVAVQRLERFRFETPVFKIRYRHGNIFGVPPGAYPAVGISYLLMLRPLPAGNHTIVVHDESTDGKVAQLTMFLKVVRDD